MVSSVPCAEALSNALVGRLTTSPTARPTSLRLGQFHESSECGLEPACVDVERREVAVETNVQEITPGGSCAISRRVNDADAHARSEPNPTRVKGAPGTMKTAATSTPHT